ncbi:hypothetical protein KKG19_06100 [Patescibacteria group bacterium]|nr:hypothetical protein [Patescibacteria group bacterium]
MLSSVLNSERAILVNIQIMRTFTRLKKVLASHEELRRKIEDIEKKMQGHDVQFEDLYKAVRILMFPPASKLKKEIGFRPDPDEE